MTLSLDIGSVGDRFRELIERARAGDEIVISEAGAPVARIVPIDVPATRGFGTMRGQVWISDDFDAPLSEDELGEWEK